MAVDDAERQRREIVRGQYERSDLTLAQIARKSGLPVDQIRQLAEQNRWSNEDREDPHFDTRLLLTRLFEAMESEISRLEARMRDDDKTSEIATLGRLAHVMEKLLALDGTLAKRKGPTRESVEMIELRQRIIRRMNELEVK
jgi:uncharacterized protein YjcR